jgi:hypothetical protein
MIQSPLINKSVGKFIDSLGRDFSNLWWPKYLFHFADLYNVLNVLKEGYLYSRNYAKNSSLLKIDSASKAVISMTNSWVYDYARLYFRPKTPTLFWVEGFCPEGKCSDKHEAHCPFPINLVFSSKRVLSIPDILFSDGNLASSHSIIYQDIKDLKELPFKKIYHDSALHDESLKREIVHHRHAEVIAKDKLPLKGFLSAIVCRSAAERETLLGMLNSSLYAKYFQMIKVRSSCFHCKRHYILNVTLKSNSIDIEYLNEYMTPFKYRYILIPTNEKRIVLDRNSAVRHFTIKRPREEYCFIVFIDGHIAYRGQFIEYPF